MALVIFAAVVVTMAVYFARGRRRLVAARERLPADDPVIYEGVVRAKVRRDYTSPFVDAKGRGIFVVVTANAIQLEFPGPGELLGMDLLIATEGARLRRARLGWVGTPLDRREYVVVAGEELKSQVELALAPEDGDLDRLERALLEVGAQRD